MSVSFESRHIGPNKFQVETMLKKVNASSLDELIQQTIPDAIRLKKPLNLPPALSEYQYQKHINKLGAKNKLYKNFIGQGYYGTITPAVIQRNILENPGWYTAYTPYQAEIAQGRLEAILNFQTMVMDLTKMEMANASLLDEATAAAEAMAMFFSSRTREQLKNNANVLFVDENCYAHTIDVLKTRSTPFGIELKIGNWADFKFDENVFGVMLQYPNAIGAVEDYKAFSNTAKEKGIMIAVATDLMSLALLTPPGEWGADCVFGSSQRFGVPMGYGGPHAAFFATKESYKRFIPGRIIGVSQDAQGNMAMRMALQTREQHIKRDKATSNICTAQALLAIMASMYAVYHGPTGVKDIASEINNKANVLTANLKAAGYKIVSDNYFDTIAVTVDNIDAIKKATLEHKLNVHYINANTVSIAVDETTDEEDLAAVFNAFAKAKNSSNKFDAKIKATNFDAKFKRTSTYLTHPVFNTHHSETDMMRYIKRLENRDLSLTFSMISLGSCTMKLNAASELYPITNPNFANLHPFVPVDQATGYTEMLEELNSSLCEITGFAKMSFQPNSGAQGEYAGLMVIRAYHISRGDAHRNVALIPSSAHGTNPASAAMAGMKIIVVKCDEKGNIDVADLKTKAEEHKNDLSCLMVTYPSTHGVFEEAIMEITNIIHANGGQVYMDGANMNAQVGLTSPGNIGADVCHLNLHKTFAIPHGGGGPGMGPIGVAKHLAEFLPGHISLSNDKNAIPAVSAAPYGSALILIISYGYIKMLGAEGVTNSTKLAILNANYIKEVLSGHFKTLYSNHNGRVAHEMILDCKEFKATAHVEVADIGKRLMDYGFHAPTISFPVADTIMVEPTESESIAELDRFCEALISIKNEIVEIIDGTADINNNVIKNSPHTAKVTIVDDWKYPYSREKAVFPLHWVKENKFWPSVSRVDNAFGDRNLICSCPSIEAYENA